MKIRNESIDWLYFGLNKEKLQYIRDPIIEIADRLIKNMKIWV